MAIREVRQSLDDGFRFIAVSGVRRPRVAKYAEMAQKALDAVRSLEDATSLRVDHPDCNYHRGSDVKCGFADAIAQLRGSADIGLRHVETGVLILSNGTRIKRRKKSQ